MSEKIKNIDILQTLTRGHNRMLQDIETYIENLVNRNIELQEQLKNFNKDDEIQRLLHENDRLRRDSVHIMNKKEKDLAKEFTDKHYKDCGGKLGFSYILTGIGMGTTIKIECNKCRIRKEITDYSDW